MGPAIVISLLVIVLCALAAVIIALLVRSTEPAKRLMRLTRAAAPAPAPDKTGDEGDGATRLLLSALCLLRTRLGLAQNERLRLKLLAAGLRQSVAVDIYFGIRLLGPVLAVLAGTFIHQNTFLWILGLMALAYVAPDIWVDYCFRRRRERIRAWPARCA